jgi:transposase
VGDRAWKGRRVDLPDSFRKAKNRERSEMGGSVSFRSKRPFVPAISPLPGNHESAGKRLSGRTRFANRTLRAALVESARGAVRKRDCYLAAQYRRLVKRRGDKKAIVAVAHSILGIAYHVLRDGQSYRELGGGYFDRLNTDRLTRYHTKRLAALGYTVTLAKHAA